MGRKIKYSDGPIGKVRVIRDFLLSPEELVLKGQNVRVTLNLEKSSVDYFKKLASSNHTQYQKVIRNLLDQYVSQVR